MSAEFSNPDGVDVLLKCCELAISNGPYVSDFHYGRLSGDLVFPGVIAKSHHGVILSDDLVGNRGELIADLFVGSHHGPFPVGPNSRVAEFGSSAQTARRVWMSTHRQVGLGTADCSYVGPSSGHHSSVI